MVDDSRSFAQDRALRVNQDVSELASLALRRLVQTGEVRPKKSKGLTHRLDELCDAFLSERTEDRHQAIRRMRHDGVSVCEIIDHVIPAIAAVLGQRWTEDTLSFVEVTIGSARLQEAVRSLIAHEVSWAATGLLDDRSMTEAEETPKPRVLLVVPRAEDHTLGVFVAADQLRRLGYEVDIALDQHPKEIAVTLKDRQYCMIGITIAGRRTLASARELVDIIRSTVTRETPIVLGGSLLDCDKDLKEATGVDHVSRTVRDALERCGLNIAELDPPRTILTNHSELEENDL